MTVSGRSRVTHVKAIRRPLWPRVQRRGAAGALIGQGARSPGDQTSLELQASRPTYARGARCDLTCQGGHSVRASSQTSRVRLAS